MLKWIKSLFQRSEKTAEGKSHGNVVSWDVYDPKEMLIYKYFDGSKWIRADPVVIYKRVMDFGPELSADISVSASKSKDAGKAREALLDKIRKVFQVQPLSETGGLTEVATMDLFDHFMEFSEQVKKNSRTSTISSEETSHTTQASSNANQTISNSVDSGSTVADPSTVNPLP